MPSDSAIPLLNVYPRQKPGRVYQRKCTEMFILEKKLETTPKPTYGRLGE